MSSVLLGLSAAGGGGIAASEDLAFTGENTFTTPATTTNRDLIGQGATVEAGLYIAPAADITSGEAVGIELDVNNMAAASLTPSSTLKAWGLTISGAGAYRSISPLSVQGPAAGWNYGLTFYNSALTGGPFSLEAP